LPATLGNGGQGQRRVQALVRVGDLVEQRPVPVVDFGRGGGGVLVQFVRVGQIDQQPALEGDGGGQPQQQANGQGQADYFLTTGHRFHRLIVSVRPIRFLKTL